MSSFVIHKTNFVCLSGVLDEMLTCNDSWVRDNVNFYNADTNAIFKSDDIKQDFNKMYCLLKDSVILQYGDKNMVPNNDDDNFTICFEQGKMIFKKFKYDFEKLYKRICRFIQSCRYQIENDILLNEFDRIWLKYDEKLQSYLTRDVEGFWGDFNLEEFRDND